MAKPYATEVDRRFVRIRNAQQELPDDKVKVKGKDRYLYRAVNSTGQTIDFLLTANRMRIQRSDSSVRASAPRGTRWQGC